MLTRAFGVTSHATAALVALFMGGLALGAWLERRLPEYPWARLYAALELGAAAAALAGTAAITRLPELISFLGGSAPLSPWARAALAAPAVLPATIFLGATLPVLARGAYSGGQTATAWLSGLYAFNTLGACLGTLAAGFWTLGAWGETATVAAAAALNAAAAVLAWGAPGGPLGPDRRTAAPRRALALYAVSGFCALGYEVLWARQLVPLLGNSIYAFALLLCAYLLGLALGSRRAPTGRALANFGLWQTALAGCVLLSLLGFRLLGLAADAPEYLYTPIRSPLDFLWLAVQALALVLPAAYCLGRLFPLAASLAMEEGASAPQAAGSLYTANTAGGVAGSLAAGFWVIDAVGVHHGFQLLTALTLSVAAWTLRRAAWRYDAKAGLAALALAVLAGLTWSDPTIEILTRRLKQLLGASARVTFHDETAAATVTGYEANGSRGLLINGIDTAGTGLPGTFMAFLPHYLMEKPSSTLVICFGAGNTFRTASKISAGPVDAADLVPALFQRMEQFYPDAREHLNKPDNRLMAEDGRQVLLRGERRYDIIIVDAAPPLFSAGAVNLYTQEFFRLADRGLSDVGILTLWLPLPSFEEDLWRVMAAAQSVFPHAATWRYGNLPGFLMFASRAPLEWPRGELERRLKARPNQLTHDINEAWIRAGFALSGADLRARTLPYPPLTDDQPIIEFPLPRFLRRARVVRDAGFLTSSP